MIKHAIYAVTLPEHRKTEAAALAQPMLEQMIARHPEPVLSQSEIGHSFRNGTHRFTIELEISEAA